MFDWLGVPHLCLHHEWPVHTHVIDDAKYIHHAFTLNLEDNAIDGNEGSCPIHSTTEEGAEKQKTQLQLKNVCKW